ncbi:hypothetical protein [Fimbriimonas ginsengisoli]|uniref:Zinc resistance-associated protein n=1 Tax=Fimbriimonas ginsengisoli Gsoil 348 TaxID=661478 RepID=A0A068NRF8_FIMGI|nr:hypothetical protein [Fimbriimonas ginsengisoli]AIE84184.1 hypothetical protein OP10G_0816 [Fimbriimonas ginsengisoli Gsoil 348]
MNNHRKKSLVVLLALLAICGSVGAIYLASPRHTALHGSEHRPKVSQSRGMTDKLTAGLNLNPAQRSAVSKVVDDVQEKMSSLFNDPKLTSKERQKKASELLKSASAQIEAHLDPDQRKRFETMIVSAHGGHG